jgi:cellulose 1,4-beta-cellobiosidase
MLWLDSQFPVGSTKPGADRGSCPTSSGSPDDMVTNHGGASVAFCKIPQPTLRGPCRCTETDNALAANIKFGPIGSTFNSGGTNPPASSSSASIRPTSTTSSSVPGPSTVPVYGQCGGSTHTGGTTCAAGSCCRAQNQWYSQCLPC